MRFRGGTVGFAMLALLVGAPAGRASTASLANGGSTVVYRGDAVADAVKLSRYVDTRHNLFYYLVTDSGGITSGSGCQSLTSITSFCRVTQGLKRYDISTGSGNDTVAFETATATRGDTAGGIADLGAGADRFTGLAAADVVKGGAGADTIDGGAGNDWLDGGADADTVSGGPGNDLVGGGDGADHVAGNDGATGSQAVPATTRSPARPATTRSTAVPATTRSSSARPACRPAPARARTTCAAATAWTG